MYVDNIILCVESKSREAMIGIVIDEIEKDNSFASINKK